MNEIRGAFIIFVYMKHLRYTLLASVLILFSCNVIKRSPKSNQTLPGYYGQWLYIKTNGSNVLPDMTKYDWGFSSNKRGMSAALKNVYEYGPSNVAGRIRGIVIDYSNTNRILIGSASGGVFLTEDAGISWRPINDQALSPSVMYMHQNPFNPKIIYYCTGEASGNSADLIGAGVFKSTDGGLTFSQLASTNNNNFSMTWTVKCSPVDTNTLYVGTHSTGLWRSTDAGATFTRVYNSGSQVNDVELFPNGSVMFTLKGSGAYYSSTGNLGSFTKVATINSVSSARAELSYCKNYPNVVYCAISGPDNGYSGVLKAFYKSSDGGKTFVTKTNPTGTVNFGFTWYALNMCVKDNDSNSLFIGSLDVGYSKNGGNTWTAGSEIHADNHISVFSGEKLYLGSDGGLAVYNWSNPNAPTVLNNNINITQFYNGAVSPHSVAIMAGSQDNGTRESSNKNKVFGSIFGGDGGYCFYHANNSSVKYVSTQNGEVYRAFQPITSNLPTNDTKWFIHPYYVSFFNGDHLVFPSNTFMYFSVDGGYNFVQKGKVSTGRLFCAATTNDANPAIFSGGSSGALLVCDSALNANSTAKDLRLSMPPILRSSFIGSIKPMPGVRNQIYIALNNISDSGRVYLVSNVFGTPVFKNISGNLPKGLPVNWIECDPLSPALTLFAGTDYGLYITEDGGKTWVKDTRIPSTVVSCIQIHKNQKDIYFFTHGRGVFKGQINNAAVSSIETVQIDWANVYPVPASEQLTVQLAEGFQKGRYQVLNLQGQVMFESDFDAQSFQFDVTGMPNATYILQINCASGNIVKSFTVSR